MKALFINPSWDQYVSKRGRRYNRHWPPLDLLACAGMLEREGWECQVFDQRLQDDERLPVADHDWIFVTSSPLDRWQCPNLDMELFARRIRSLPADRTCLLGAHGTMNPVETLQLAGKSVLVRGEPEIPVLKLARGERLEDIAGISYLRSGEVVSNPDSVPPPLDQMAPPAYHLVDISRYSYELLGDNLVLLEASRGCPHSCTYCYLGMYPRYRLKPPGQVVEEIARVLQQSPHASIYFIDLEFAIRRRHTLNLMDAIIESGLSFPWACQTRADSVDMEVLTRMKRAGCRLVHYGVETASPRIMEMVNKRLELDQVRRAVELTGRAGLDTACFFMLGFPTESEAEIAGTVDFAKKLNPTYASFHIATPYPGTRMYDEHQGPSGENFMDESFRPALPLSTLKRLERQAYLRYYLRPRYWLSQLFRNPAGSWRRAQLFLQFLAVG